MGEKMWRPTNWANPYKQPVREGVTWNKEVIDAYEKGADAMLEALTRENCNGKLFLRIVKDNEGEMFVKKYPLRDAFLNDR